MSPTVVASTDPRTRSDARARDANATGRGSAVGAPATIEGLPGVGPRLAVRLRQRFGDDAAFFAAARAGDLGALTAIDGVSARKAAEFVRAARGELEDTDLLQDPGARRVADAVVDRLVRCAATRAGADRLRLLAPLRDRDEAMRRVRHVLASRDRVATLDRKAVTAHLRALRPLQEPRPRQQTERLVVVDHPRLEDGVADLVRGWASVDGPAALRRAEDHELVLVVTEEGMDLDGLDHVVELPVPVTRADLVPEAELAWAEVNRPVLVALSRLAGLLGDEDVAAAALEALGTGPAAKDIDLRATAERVLRESEVGLQERAAALALSGSDVLAALGSRPPASLQRLLDEAQVLGRQRMREATGLDVHLFQAGLPLRLDDDAIEAAERARAGRRAADLHEARRRAARTIAAARPAIAARLDACLAFDADFALGCFALDHGLQEPRIGEAVAFSGSIHLDLAATKDAQRIDYHLGGPDRIALLTGANSGGKSTLLEHIAQLVIMPRLGLPVVGQATVPWVDQVHLVTAKRGLDAGAFETFLRGFLPLAMGHGTRLVLVDEVEAVTELEAAGRILGFFIDRFAAGPGLAVVATHLAPQVLRHVQGRVRVDGIEASRLDDQHRLVVDRCPRIGVLARSTPELIVRRLAATSRGADAALYDDLLSVLTAAAADGEAAK